MKPSPTMQQLIEQLAAKHGINLSEPPVTQRLTMPEHDDWLVIYTADGRHVSLSRCYEDKGVVDTDPFILLLTDYPTGWLPLDLLYSPSAWEAFVQATGSVDDPDAVDLADLTEYWARRLIAQGWLQRSQKLAAPYGRLPGCQSTNHTKCYGELWQCAACGKRVCYAEGTDNQCELCDDCWASQCTAVNEVNRQAVASTGEGTLGLVCACSEQCGTWLELTADGVLALEDKDGLRVSILLPDWLEEAMRNAMLAHTQGMAEDKIASSC